MNRKCAAGTGAFLEEMSLRLDIPLEAMDALARSSEGMVELGSFCTVFTGTEVLEKIRQGKKVPDIVKGLLQFSHQSETKMTAINVNDLLNNTLSLIEKQAIFHNIEVKKKFAENLPLITVDESQFQQVFINVILNATQAMKEMGTLTLETEFNKKENSCAANIAQADPIMPYLGTHTEFSKSCTTPALKVARGTNLVFFVYQI